MMPAKLTRFFVAVLSLSLSLTAALANPAAAKGTSPDGKGMFVVSIVEWCIAKKFKYSGDDQCVKEYARRIADNEIDWVVIETYKTGKGRVNGDGLIASLAAAIRAAKPGTPIWLWAWIEPTDKDLEGAASDLVAAAVAVDAKGVILDVEGKWSNKKREDEARTLMTKLMSEADANDLAVGIASYPGFKGSAQIDWPEFSVADFGLPMIGTGNRKKAEQSVCAWKTHGFDRIVPILYFTGSGTTKDDAWDLHKIPHGAAAWWSWRGADVSASAKKTTKHWELFRSYSLADHAFDLADCK